MATKAVITPARARKLLADLPLVTLTRAAKILGIAPPNVSRLKQQGRFPDPVVEVEGGAGAYAKVEIEELRDELARERAERDGGG